jgi:serine/threonine-protein kinase RIO1
MALRVDEPVIIDLPQAVDAAGNNHAQRMLLRDVANLRDFFGQFAPELLTTTTAPKSGACTRRGLLSNETPLTGHYERAHADVDMRRCCARLTMRGPKMPRAVCACRRRRVNRYANVFTLVPTAPWVAKGGCGSACRSCMAELACWLSAFFSTSILTASDVLDWAAAVAACTAVELEMFMAGL